MSLSSDSVDRGLQTLRDVLVDHLKNGHGDPTDLLHRLESFTEVPLARRTAAEPTGYMTVDGNTVDENRSLTELHTVLQQALVNCAVGNDPRDWAVTRTLFRAIQNCQIHHVRTVADNGDVKFASDDVTALKRLVVYAYETLCAMEGRKDGSTWMPFDHVSGMLSQLSNILAGIRREAESSVKSSNYHGEQYARLCGERDAALKAQADMREDYVNTCQARDSLDSALQKSNRARTAAFAVLYSLGWNRDPRGVWQPLAQSLQPTPKNPHTACFTCGQPATWVRCTQVGGGHFYCTEHAKEQRDFGKSNFGETNDDRFFWQRVEDMKPDKHDGVPA